MHGYEPMNSLTSLTARADRASQTFCAGMAGRTEKVCEDNRTMHGYLPINSLTYLTTRAGQPDLSGTENSMGEMVVSGLFKRSRWGHFPGVVGGRRSDRGPWSGYREVMRNATLTHLNAHVSQKSVVAVMPQQKKGNMVVAVMDPQTLANAPTYRARPRELR